MKKKKCPGSKIRSKGKGRGLGIGKGKGPIGRRWIVGNNIDIIKINMLTVKNKYVTHSQHY